MTGIRLPKDVSLLKARLALGALSKLQSKGDAAAKLLTELASTGGELCE